MIKKTLFILTLGFSFQGQINARAVLPTDSIKQTHLLHQEEILKPLEPTLLPNEVAYSNWKSNWFFNVSGGTSAFIGSPLGCEDLFGRMKPTLAISAGLAGNITGSLDLAILGIHCYILSCHILELKCPDRKSTTGAPFAKE